MGTGKRFVLGMLACVVLATATPWVSAGVMDSFTFTSVDSITGLETGTATGNYMVAGYLVSGTLTEIDTGTFAGEAEISATVNGVTTQLDPFAGTNNFVGSVVVSNHATWCAAPIAVSVGDMYTFDFLESFVDGPPDATWDTITIKVGSLDTVLTRVGSIGANSYAFIGLSVLTGGGFIIDTNGSSFDTELAIWNSGGILLVADDDSGTGLQSQFSIDLAAGDYTVAVAGFNAAFSDGPSVIPGLAFGNYILTVRSLDGAAEFTEAAAMPEPAALGLLGLAMLGLRRRRC